jgi:hypothetical protein
MPQNDRRKTRPINQNSIGHQRGNCLCPINVGALGINPMGQGAPFGVNPTGRQLGKWAQPDQLIAGQHGGSVEKAGSNRYSVAGAIRCWTCTRRSSVFSSRLDRPSIAGLGPVKPRSLGPLSGPAAKSMPQPRCVAVVSCVSTTGLHLRCPRAARPFVKFKPPWPAHCRRCP